MPTSTGIKDILALLGCGGLGILIMVVCVAGYLFYIQEGFIPEGDSADTTALIQAFRSFQDFMENNQPGGNTNQEPKTIYATATPYPDNEEIAETVNTAAEEGTVFEVVTNQVTGEVTLERVDTNEIGVDFPIPPYGEELNFALSKFAAESTMLFGESNNLTVISVVAVNASGHATEGPSFRDLAFQTKFEFDWFSEEEIPRFLKSVMADGIGYIFIMYPEEKRLESMDVKFFYVPEGYNVENGLFYTDIEAHSWIKDNYPTNVTNVNVSVGVQITQEIEVCKFTAMDTLEIKDVPMSAEGYLGRVVEVWSASDLGGVYWNETQMSNEALQNAFMALDADEDSEDAAIQLAVESWEEGGAAYRNFMTQLGLLAFDTDYVYINTHMTLSNKSCEDSFGEPLN